MDLKEEENNTELFPLVCSLSHLLKINRNARRGNNYLCVYTPGNYRFSISEYVRTYRIKNDNIYRRVEIANCYRHRSDIKRITYRLLVRSKDKIPEVYRRLYYGYYY